MGNLQTKVTVQTNRQRAGNTPNIDYSIHHLSRTKSTIQTNKECQDIITHRSEKYSKGSNILCVHIISKKEKEDTLSFFHVEYNGVTSPSLTPKEIDSHLDPSHRPNYNFEGTNNPITFSYKLESEQFAQFVYTLYHTSINEKTKKVNINSWRLLIKSNRHGRDFVFSPDSSYLLIFGGGCTFLNLPPSNFENHKWSFHTFTHINHAHWVNDYLLVCTDGHYTKDVLPTPWKSEKEKEKEKAEKKGNAKKNNRKEKPQEKGMEGMIIDQYDPNTLFLLNLKENTQTKLDMAHSG